eukprot:CAMPEP_0174361980 /NCGR_PEP_ID=MMETSP0811_2-20130205/62002_1 /TAXON_ID=73025 ORGANISM="Eutreptiella gymnastica-like, Strain CCMP1594" /NCGR_SAMPLE_ID=MMETSP0811_2 /ASSEMBLY_ACC=CAM_ASM_000667 /LENGTH=161 /DNA_ID=CAMNT_0015499157 /DNA_START=910 /DNA_END=1393 /DNA_ORIENTATION=-
MKSSSWLAIGSDILTLLQQSGGQHEWLPIFVAREQTNGMEKVHLGHARVHSHKMIPQKPNWSSTGAGAAQMMDAVTGDGSKVMKREFRLPVLFHSVLRSSGDSYPVFDSRRANSDAKPRHIVLDLFNPRRPTIQQTLCCTLPLPIFSSKDEHHDRPPTAKA